MEEQCDDCDVLWVKLQPKSRTRPLYLCCAYLSPPNGSSYCAEERACSHRSCGRNHPERGIDFVANTVPKYARLGDIIVCGDLNACSQWAVVQAPGQAPPAAATRSRSKLATPPARSLEPDGLPYAASVTL